MKCPYCEQSNKAKVESALWLDVGARALGFGRRLLELRAQGASLREIASHSIGGTTPGKLNPKTPRTCPYCRKARLSTEAPLTLWIDFGVRALGMTRGFLRVRGGGFRALATSMVDGDDAGARVAQRAEVVDVTPEAAPKAPPKAPKKKQSHAEKFAHLRAKR